MLLPLKFMTRSTIIVLESKLEILYHNFRVAFMVFLGPIVLVGLVGNSVVLVRIVVAPSKQFPMLKPFYRSALISFAMSDLLLLFASGTNTLMMVNSSISLMWTLPDWTCSAIPYIQTVAIFVGSLTLAGIAIDRYRALIPLYFSTSDDFKWPHAIFFNFIIWLVAVAASYPILGLYKIDYLHVVRGDLTFYEGRICTTDQDHATLVYTALFITIFVPLAMVFVTVHVLLALNIWRRQEQNDKSRFYSRNDSQSTEFSTVSSDTQQSKLSTNGNNESTQTHRRKRTVNIILVLILVFLIGRLPVWISLLFKLHSQLSSGTLWAHLQVFFSGLILFNAALDPFLYVFLCEALSLVSFLRIFFNEKKELQVTTPDDEPVPPENVDDSILFRGRYTS